MSSPGQPQGEFRSAQHEAAPLGGGGGADEPWAEANNRYLAESLQWLRLRLRRWLPPEPVVVTAPSPSVMAGDSLAAHELTPPRRAWFNFGEPPALLRTEMPRLAAPLRASNPQAEAAADEEALAQAAAARQAAAQVEPPPALLMLAERLGLSEFERDTLLLCVAAELDPGLASSFAQIQGHPSRATPSFALALQVLPDPSWDALSPHRPLRYARLVELDPSAGVPLTTAPLRADERIVHYVKGLNIIDERLGKMLLPASGPAANEPPPLSASQQAVAQAVLAQLQAAGARARIPRIELVGSDAGSRLDVARQVCFSLGRHLYPMAPEALPTQKGETDGLVRLWQRECLLLPIALYLDAAEIASAPAEQAQAFHAFVSRDIGLAFIGLREPLAQGGGGLSFDVARPTVREQHDAWLAALAGVPLQEPAESVAPLLAGQFDLNLRDLHESLALAAAPGQTTLRQSDLWRACRRRVQPRLDQLAQRLDPKATWDDLVLADEATALLRQVAAQVRNRYQVHQAWGFAERMTRGLGISALFAGESGTGKTLAAEVIANELDLALYRIDLSAVVSKYIGETEKNLRKLFDAAEQGGAILLFDEADALFGKRSEVKDSHDRYANIEINYLLQRMEAFSGLAILATNMKTALDSAFMRRLRFIVNFAYPGPAERQRMWRQALPPGLPTDGLDFERLARFGLSGGNIHSVVLNAGFMAAARATPVLTQSLLLAAVRTELRKLEKPVNEAEFR